VTVKNADGDTQSSKMLSIFDFVGERRWGVINKFLKGVVSLDTSVWVKGFGFNYVRLPDTDAPIVPVSKNLNAEHKTLLRKWGAILVSRLDRLARKFEERDSINESADEYLQEYNQVYAHGGAIRVGVKGVAAAIKFLHDNGFIIFVPVGRNYGRVFMLPTGLDASGVYLPDPPDPLPDEVRQSTTEIARDLLHRGFMDRLPAAFTNLDAYHATAHGYTATGTQRLVYWQLIIDKVALGVSAGTSRAVKNIPIDEITAIGQKVIQQKLDALLLKIDKIWDGDKRVEVVGGQVEVGQGSVVREWDNEVIDYPVTVTFRKK
jgi:hypothetical protein